MSCGGGAVSLSASTSTTRNHIGVDMLRYLVLRVLRLSALYGFLRRGMFTACSE
jgi:predicted acyltransferase